MFRLNRLFVGLLVFLVICGSINVYFYTRILSQEKNTDIEKIANEEFIVSKTKEARRKVILLWSKYYTTSWHHFGFAEGKKNFQKCEFRDCELTTQRSRLDEADALLFKDTDLDEGDIPHLRHHWQRYVFFGLETITRPQTTNFTHSAWKNFFNWTATYMSHSDIYSPYGFIVSMAPHDPTHDYMANKSKLAVWVVSNCQHAPSQRSVLVDKLRKYIPIDIFGRCGKPMPEMCEKASPHSVDGCLSYMTSRYKFYLGLENDLCQDWVTEKWFKWADKDIIVVQLADKRISLMPREGVINVFDYNSAADLAAQMLKLANNRTLYNNFFKWRNNYDICSNSTGQVRYWCNQYHKRMGKCDSCTQMGDGFGGHMLCGLCRKLHTDSSYSSYPNIQRWWDECQWNVDWSQF